ncbi:hypothetical protein Taro_001543 [Colocasia esculenta]|uniref:Uncharacterized protein n=1 Tax=Colocasia esculenta TaxID=4460 RepID=A0A843TEX4_COLES|nr:hypothetical protein [Colocasia esculenta]
MDTNSRLAASDVDVNIPDLLVFRSGNASGNVTPCVYRFYLGSVDTPLTGVDTHPTQYKRQKLSGKGEQSGKRASASRGAEQGRQGKKKEKKRRSSVSTLPELVSTLVTLPREPVLLV